MCVCWSPAVKLINRKLREAVFSMEWSKTQTTIIGTQFDIRYAFGIAQLPEPPSFASPTPAKNRRRLLLLPEITASDARLSEDSAIRLTKDRRVFQDDNASLASHR